ncbi:hypothetical protein FGIG_02546 [Fasciola gigantica]|uniref:Uncharacterized protein n=1 Tax=Fasciola gigantica TaxID=46835 RepID=A0A504Z2J4_FASGI|nr:hypothetical protein FGIG_02546 [Fasciola gigantica]
MDSQSKSLKNSVPNNSILTTLSEYRSSDSEDYMPFKKLSDPKISSSSSKFCFSIHSPCPGEISSGRMSTSLPWPNNTEVLTESKETDSPPNETLQRKVLRDSLISPLRRLSSEPQQPSEASPTESKFQLSSRQSELLTDSRESYPGPAIHDQSYQSVSTNTPKIPDSSLPDPSEPSRFGKSLIDENRKSVLLEKQDNVEEQPSVISPIKEPNMASKDRSPSSFDGSYPSIISDLHSASTPSVQAGFNGLIEAQKSGSESSISNIGDQVLNEESEHGKSDSLLTDLQDSSIQFRNSSQSLKSHQGEEISSQRVSMHEPTSEQVFVSTETVHSSSPPSLSSSNFKSVYLEPEELNEPLSSNAVARSGRKSREMTSEIRPEHHYRTNYSCEVSETPLSETTVFEKSTKHSVPKSQVGVIISPNESLQGTKRLRSNVRRNRLEKQPGSLPEQVKFKKLKKGRTLRRPSARGNKMMGQSVAQYNTLTRRPAKCTRSICYRPKYSS